MKALERFIIRNWFWIALGCVLQRKAIEMQYLDRGYRAVGGEWFVLPVILLAVELGRGIYWTIVEVMQMEDEDDTRVERNRRRIQR